MKIGIYQSYWGVVGGGQRYVAVVAETLARQHDVEIVHHHEGFDPKAIEEPMQVDLSSVRFRYLPSIVRPNWPSLNPLRRLRLERELGREISEGYDLFIDSSDIPPFFNHARRGALLIHFPLVTFDEYHGHTSPDWLNASPAKRKLKGLFHRLEWKQRFASYDRFIVNSAFTKAWTKRLWGLDSEIVFPPLREGLRPSPSKEQWILSIGAFRGAQHKKQTVAMNTFKSLCDAGLRGWRYIMVGACGPDPEDREYVKKIRESVDGYDIDIRCDVSGSELKKLLESSSVLWHSMGYGVDEDREPRRMEHFGMVATEAMACGCIPVVFRGGGLPEIVGEGECGYLWSNVDELKEKTMRLTTDQQKRECLSRTAVTAADRFARPEFERRLSAALRPMLV